MQLVHGRPEDCTGRLGKEVRVYDFLDSLGIQYQRIDHEAAMTMEACAAIDEVLNATICKNLMLCNRQNTVFYLLEAALLYLGALAVLAAEQYAELRRCRGEFATLLSMGAHHRQLDVFCRPALIIAAVSLLISLAASACLILLFTEGSFYLRPLFIIFLTAALGGLHLGIHAWICRRFTRGIAKQNPAHLLKEEL